MLCSKASFKKCRNACQNNDLCEGWSFKKKKNGEENCKLISKLSMDSESTKNKEHNQKFISGTKNCSVAQSNSTIQGTVRDSGLLMYCKLLTVSALSLGSGKSSRALTLTSPNFPQNYQNYENKRWNVWTGTGRVLGFSFTTFELEEGYDWVKVTDRGSGRVLFYNYPRNAPSGKLKTFDSDSNSVHIQFKTDYSVTRKGFSLNIWGRPKSKY